MVTVLFPGKGAYRYLFGSLFAFPVFSISHTVCFYNKKTLSYFNSSFWLKQTHFLKKVFTSRNDLQVATEAMILFPAKADGNFHNHSPSQILPKSDPRGEGWFQQHQNAHRGSRALTPSSSPPASPGHPILAESPASSFSEPCPLGQKEPGSK